jgi:hypothetical protein
VPVDTIASLPVSYPPPTKLRHASLYAGGNGETAVGIALALSIVLGVACHPYRRGESQQHVKTIGHIS